MLLAAWLPLHPAAALLKFCVCLSSMCVRPPPVRCAAPTHSRQASALVSELRAAPSACLSSLDLVLASVSTGRNAHIRTASLELLEQALKAQPAGQSSSRPRCCGPGLLVMVHGLYRAASSYPMYPMRFFARGAAFCCTGSTHLEGGWGVACCVAGLVVLRQLSLHVYQRHLPRTPPHPTPRFTC